MSYSIQVLTDGSYQVVFEDEPNYCRALAMAPTEMEPELEKEVWLILLFAIWSVPDRTSIEEALSAAKKLNGRFNLGVRPFDNHKENKGWCKQIKEQWGSPIWLVIRKGTLVEEIVGLRNRSQIIDLLKKWL
ncbi:MAG: hypothetical protein HY231_00020 [Acidobacteria bacterium]|nr:hypothetical protein [Acidobacteriota bacterium]